MHVGLLSEPTVEKLTYVQVPVILSKLSNETITLTNINKRESHLTLRTGLKCVNHRMPSQKVKKWNPRKESNRPVYQEPTDFFDKGRCRYASEYVPKDGRERN
jgi:hypothetical protein